MHLGNQPVEVGKRAEDRVDAFVLRNIVPEVLHRRGVDRREPDGIDAKPFQVIKPRENSGQVSDAVAIRILERSRIDLVDDPLLPPFMLLRHGTLLARRLTTCSVWDCARRSMGRPRLAAHWKLPNCCSPLAHFPVQTYRIAGRWIRAWPIEHRSAVAARKRMCPQVAVAQAFSFRTRIA